MTGRLNVGGQDIHRPAARLAAPDLAIVDLTKRGVSGSWLAFSTPDAAREVAEACEAAAKLLERPQVMEAP